MNEGSAAARKCLNCGQPLAGRYCASCGQEDHPLAVALPRLILDFLSDAFQFDARIWHTLGLMLFHPGRLTSEYLAGRRQRYIPPVRLYLFVSIVFFVILELLPTQIVHVRIPSYQLQPTAPRTEARTGTAAANTAPSPGAATNLGGAVKAGLAQAARGQSPAVAKHTHGFEAWIMARSRAAQANPAQFRHQFWSSVPKVLFFLIPLFALLLKILYVFRRRYYSEHLIFALHYHSVVFLNGLLIVLLTFGAHSTPRVPADILRWAAGLLTLWTALYLFPALRTTYTDSWPRVIGRGAALMLGYMVALLFGTVAAVGITFAMS